MSTVIIRSILLVFMLITVSSCTGPTSQKSEPKGYTLITPRTLQPGDPVPPPTGEVVLSITGKISRPYVDNRLDFDLATLEQLDQISYSVEDAGIRRRATYQGVLLSQVLEMAGIAPDAKELHAVALDDYETVIPLTVRQWPVMLATLRDGQRMGVGEKGPIEIVFPYDSYPIDPAAWDPKWVWSLRTLEVR